MIAIVNTRKEEAAEVGRLREQERALLQTEAWQNQKVDEKLASDAFLAPDRDRDDPKVVAFRILGAIYQMNPTGDSDAPFHAQIRRLQPGKTDADYQKLYRYASKEWMEVYGY